MDQAEGDGLGMAKRQARFTPQDLEHDPRLLDDSPELWPEDLGEVARKLLTSAVRCFAANGYHATTTRDIAAGVGLSPAAMYVHFPTKELVLFKIVRSGHERALADLQTSEVAQSGDAVRTLRVLISRYTAWHARHHVTARVAQYELSGLTAEHYEDILHLRHQTNEVFRHAVAKGVADSTFDQVDVNRVVRAMLSLAIDLIRWYRLDGSDHPDELGEFYADLALKMVTSPAAPAPGPTRRLR